MQETSDGAQKHPPLWFPDLCSQDAPHVGCRGPSVGGTDYGNSPGIFPWPSWLPECLAQYHSPLLIVGLSLTEADCRASSMGWFWPTGGSTVG